MAPPRLAPRHPQRPAYSVSPTKTNLPLDRRRPFLGSRPRLSASRRPLLGWVRNKIRWVRRCSGNRPVSEHQPAAPRPPVSEASAPLRRTPIRLVVRSKTNRLAPPPSSARPPRSPPPVSEPVLACSGTQRIRHKTLVGKLF